MCRLAFALLLISVLKDSLGKRFFISAPNVFHVGVKEKVLIQMDDQDLNQPIMVYLQDPNDGSLMSTRDRVQCSTENKIQIAEIMIDRNKWSQIKRKCSENPYLDLVAELPGRQNKLTKVLISDHRGYIFIQTDQPMYNPTQNVQYRIFTLNHMFRPHMETVRISVFNADGNKIMNTLRATDGGIYQGHFPIPSVSQMGTFKITAHYGDDEENAAVREFKVQNFVLPSFEVSIETQRRYILLTDQHFDFTITAMYSYGEPVKGAYHCQFGVLTKEAAKGQKKPRIIGGLELTGSIVNGRAIANLTLVNDIFRKQLNLTLRDLQKRGSKLYVGVFVTNIQNGEIQQGEAYIPIFPRKFSIDLSQTRSHFLPGFPLDVVVVVRYPDGTNAVNVPVNISLSTSDQEFWQGSTDQDGRVFSTFNVISTSSITLTVSADDHPESKFLKPASSPSGSFLYIAITNKVYHVNDFFSVTFNTVNGPSNGYIYYMVLSRGMIIRTGSVPLGTSAKHNLLITADMVPSFRLIGYYHGKSNDIIADSVWVDVRDECEIKVTVTHTGNGSPGKQKRLDINLHNQEAKVALLAVDKAFYGLKADNKLTDKQVFSTMASYDLGCAYSGGSDPAAVLIDAGLAFASEKKQDWRRNFGCQSHVRSRRAVDLDAEKAKLKLQFEDAELQICCTNAFSHIPMRDATCETRSKRVLLVKGNPECAAAFLTCCRAAENLRKKKIREDAVSGLGRISTADIERLISEEPIGTIRRYFPPSFDFKVFSVNNKKSHLLMLPDSITTWEIQVVTLSPETGLCVAKPHEIRAFKESFVSLRLPHSVKRFEQLSVSPVIYNYGEKNLRVAVHMEQTEGLCSPASATTTSYSEITVTNHSAQFVSFSVVPMVTGLIPIKISVFDIDNELGIDSLEKSLKVQTEGIQKREDKTMVFYLDGMNSRTLDVDGTLPDGTVPDSSSNIFISMEGNAFDGSIVEYLLSPEKVSNLIKLPGGCLEQTTSKLAPTVLAVRYLDLSRQWFNLKAGARNEAYDNIEHGYMRILSFQKPDGSYATWNSQSKSNWVTALVVKILSLIVERQTAGHGEQGQMLKIVPEERVKRSVDYLLSVQRSDGSFRDPQPVLHRHILTGTDEDASITAFITLALIRSLEVFTSEDKQIVETSIRKAKAYLRSQLEELSHTYAVAITAYCLSVHLPQENDRLRAWEKLQSMVTKDENDCYMWANAPGPESKKAITIETTAYALLTAVKNNDTKWANKTACWLVSQENPTMGYKSTQDTLLALEALSEYELEKTTGSIVDVTAEFTVPGKNGIISLSLTKKSEKVEIDLEKLTGKNITLELKGKGDIKLKIVKAYHLLDPEDYCSKLNISVTVEGKVKYTSKILENYEYYDDYDATEEKQTRVVRSAIERFDALTQSKRDLENDLNSDSSVTYTVCVSYNPNSPLTGMSIADITLLSGFEVDIEDLERLKEPPEQYISHYEISSGRLLMYLNKLYETRECLSFTANQKVKVGLLQPAPATFYDYYEPDIKCTVFYSPPRRSKLVSTLCSQDVCQCAERPCHKVQETFNYDQGKRITKQSRVQYACFSPRVDYAYIVEVQDVSLKSNFELYKTNIVETLKLYGDLQVATNSVRVFAKRLQCKGQLEIGRQYLIMGRDGSTKDTNGNMQYLLESNTWVEKKAADMECMKTKNKRSCVQFNEFIEEYKTDGCKQ